MNAVAVLGNTSKSNQAGTLSYLDPHIRDAPTKHSRACGCTCAAATVEKRQEKERHKPGTCQSLAWWAGSIGLPRMPTSADRKLPMTPGLGNIKSLSYFLRTYSFEAANVLNHETTRGSHILRLKKHAESVDKRPFPKVPADQHALKVGGGDLVVWGVCAGGERHGIMSGDR